MLTTTPADAVPFPRYLRIIGALALIAAVVTLATACQPAEYVPEPLQPAVAAFVGDDHSSPPADAVPVNPYESLIPAPLYAYDRADRSLCSSPVSTLAIPCGDVILWANPGGTVWLMPERFRPSDVTPTLAEVCASLAPVDQRPFYGCAS